MQWKNYDALIFDLGGVILNIDYGKTASAFVDLGIQDFDSLYSQAAQTDLFDQFETGKISAFHFINRLLDLLPKGCNANQVVHAWNAMILDFPMRRIELLAEISSDIPVFLLSNTNELHISHFERLFREQTGMSDFRSLFTKVYYSSEVGLRKPDREIFDFVVAENDLDPSKTLFLDDTERHLAGAAKAGLHTMAVTSSADIHSLLS